MAMHCFQGVAIGIPEGAGAFHAQDQRQNVRFVHWTTGELRMDDASFGLVFSPAGCKGLSSKPLGCLTGAEQHGPPEPNGLSTFVVTTNGSVQSLFRLNFQRQADEEAFKRLAQDAACASSGRYPGAAGRSSIPTSGRRSSVEGGCGGGSFGAETPLEAHIRERHPGTFPVIVHGAELCGPDPGGDQGSVALHGRGAAVLLDPPETGRVGTYELLFYDEEKIDPVLRLPVGPRTRLTWQAEDMPMGRMSTATRRSTAPRMSSAPRMSTAPRRLSLAPGGDERKGLFGLAGAFELSAPGVPDWSIGFDSEVDAGAFARDLGVRQRLVALSLKTSRSWRVAEGLQDELEEMRHMGLLNMIWRLTFRCVVLLFLGLLFYTVALYASEPERPPVEVATAALQDASAFAAFVGAGAVDTGAAVCRLLGRSVPAAAMDRCMEEPEWMEARSCLAALSASA
mmetsp:Transcript_97245/g.197518  ORF Transcript_97245/g.197518 Transcript_97245/m.197518 type:complete len:454 (-) Transcript_97245:68-1429(-)